MIYVDPPKRSKPKPLVEDIQHEIQSADEIGLTLTVFATRDASTGRYDFDRARLDTVHTLVGGTRLDLPIDTITSQADQAAINRQALEHWETIEQRLMERWERDNDPYGWSDPD